VKLPGLSRNGPQVLNNKSERVARDREMLLVYAGNIVKYCKVLFKYCEKYSVSIEALNKNYHMFSSAGLSSFIKFESFEKMLPGII